MISKREVSFCVDTLLVQTVLCEDKMHKQAGIIGDLLSKVKEEVMSHIDKNHPVESVLKLLAPGALWVIMQGFGLGKWGFFLGLLADYFHVDIPGFLGSIFEKAKPLITGGKPISSEQIDNVTDSVAQEHATEGAQADDHKAYSSLELMDEARFMRLALVEYERQKMRLTKEGADVNDFLGFGGARAKSTSLFAKIVGWIFKVVLASAGLMVAGDVAHSVLGTSPSESSGGSGSSSTPSGGPVSKQTKFPVKGDPSLPATVSIVNNEQNIENMVIQFAKDVYSGLDGKENLIRNTAGFKAVVNEIAWYNTHSEGASVVMLPSQFGSKKHLVDYFIDDVAAASP